MNMQKTGFYLIALLALSAAAAPLGAQGRGGRGAPPPNGQAGAVVDLTGYWVSIVTEDWRYRMMTPAKGATLEQVKKARPTFDYDGGYGADTGPWTTDMFVEAVYRELSARPR